MLAPFYKSIIKTGLIAGALDASAASLQYWLTTHKTPERVFIYVASAVFGKDAYNYNPVMMTITGLLFHFLIAMTFTVLFYLVYPRLMRYRHSVLLVAITYGLLVWSIMNLLVVPLSRIAKSPVRFPQSYIQMGILIICIGCPIALRAARYFTKPQLQPA